MTHGALFNAIESINNQQPTTMNLQDKIKVTAEGRAGLFLIEPDEAKRFVRSLGTDEIHHWNTTNPSILIGSDWDVESVCEMIDAIDARIAFVLDPNWHGRHQLVVTTSRGRHQFDVGEITEDLLETNQEVK